MSPSWGDGRRTDGLDHCDPSSGLIRSELSWLRRIIESRVPWFPNATCSPRRPEPRRLSSILSAKADYREEVVTAPAAPLGPAMARPAALALGETQARRSVCRDAHPTHSRSFVAVAEQLRLPHARDRQRAVGLRWQPVLLTSGKHHASGNGLRAK